ncbi:hypothetical protein [Flavobacterium croceum]|uniref:hypothetical protein n=1 Tax=Flavobacterium croceum TaxID=370975 RepID=UPI0024A7C1DE|nr:hypothetical protein [Flavobacterium croceum]
MNRDLQLKDRIRKNWLCILFAIAFLITLMNYFELKTENNRLKNNSEHLKDRIDDAEEEKSDLEDENENLEEENENLKNSYNDDEY